MAIIKAVQPQKNVGRICSGILKACFPTQDEEPSEVGIIFDSYKVTTTKQLTQMRRGTPGKVIHISSQSLFMPNGSDWDCFLFNAENKSPLIRTTIRDIIRRLRLFVRYF